MLLLLAMVNVTMMVRSGLLLKEKVEACVLVVRLSFWPLRLGCRLRDFEPSLTELFREVAVEPSFVSIQLDDLKELVDLQLQNDRFDPHLG